MITTKARLDNLDTVDGRHSDNFDTVCFDMLLEHPENFFFLGLSFFLSVLLLRYP